MATPPGQAEISGELGYDPNTAQILLHNHRIDRLDFSVLGPREVEVSARLYQEWELKVTNPMRVDLPSHPLLLPFMQGIRDIGLEDEGLVIDVVVD